MLHHSLEIHQREDQGITILDLRGKLDLGRGDIALQDFVGGLLEHGNRQLILDLAHVSDIDDAGAGMLLILAEQYQAAGGKLVLLQADSVHAEIYERARVEAMVQVYGNQLDAVNSFFPDRTVTHYDILDYVESHTPHEETRENDKDHKS
jgi:anti-sigma B factor antagonist